MFCLLSSDAEKGPRHRASNAALGVGQSEAIVRKESFTRYCSGNEFPLSSTPRPDTPGCPSVRHETSRCPSAGRHSRCSRVWPTLLTLNAALGRRAAVERDVTKPLSPGRSEHCIHVRHFDQLVEATDTAGRLQKSIVWTSTCTAAARTTCRCRHHSSGSPLKRSRICKRSRWRRRLRYYRTPPDLLRGGYPPDGRSECRDRILVIA